MTHDTTDHAAMSQHYISELMDRYDRRKEQESIFTYVFDKDIDTLSEIAVHTDALVAENAALRTQVDAEQARGERFARAAMYAAQFIETVPQLNGVTQIAAYNRFEENWMTTLTAADMTFARGVVGLPEPGGDLPADGEEA